MHGLAYVKYTESYAIKKDDLKRHSKHEDGLMQEGLPQEAGGGWAYTRKMGLGSRRSHLDDFGEAEHESEVLLQDIEGRQHVVPRLLMVEGSDVPERLCRVAHGVRERLVVWGGGRGREGGREGGLQVDGYTESGQ